MRSDNPFAKSETLTVGSDVSWEVDTRAMLATKTASDNKGTYYHLQFDNRQLKLFISDDSSGKSAKSFNQLEIKDVQIDGKQNSLFKWCLQNQERHSRFLQQGLSVKKGVCIIDGTAGTFIMRLNKDTLKSLQNGKELLIMLKPFRTALELQYDLTDFKAMTQALNAGSRAKPAAVAAVAKPAVKPRKKCKAKPPANYSKVKSLEYFCDDAKAKKDAETKVAAAVEKEKARQQKLAAEKEKQRKLAEEKKQKELALKLEQEKLLAAEAAAIAASEAKQMQINDDITQKMVGMCKKYWDKGEHRCYCEKYIEYAPAAIAASSTCN